MGILVHDPKFKAQMQKTMENLEASTGILSKSSADLKETTVGLPEMTKKVDDFLTDLKKAGKSLPELVTEARPRSVMWIRSSKAAQKSWLLRRNVPQAQRAYHQNGCRSGKGLIMPGYGRWLLVLCLWPGAALRPRTRRICRARRFP